MRFVSFVFLLSEILSFFSSSSSQDTLETISYSQSYLGPLLPLHFYENVFGMNAVNIYRENRPIPHIFIDNFFPQDLLRDVVSEFPSSSGRSDPATPPTWIQSEINCQFRKLEISSHALGPATSYVISQLQSSMFIRFLEVLTGIDSLIPDPHLYGAGPHQTLSGGYLPSI